MSYVTLPSKVLIIILHRSAGWQTGCSWALLRFVGRCRCSCHYFGIGESEGRRFWCSPVAQGLQHAQRPYDANIVVTGKHWTGPPNKSIDQIGKKCPKNVRKLCSQPLRPIFGHLSAIFSAFFRQFVDIPFFLGCPTICPLQ